MSTILTLLCAYNKRVDIEIRISKQVRYGGIDDARQRKDGMELAHLCYTTLPSGTMDAFFAEYGRLGFRALGQPIILDTRNTSFDQPITPNTQEGPPA